MKLINKKSLALSLILSSSLFASTYEYPQLYKDTKIMGMGGANIAIGGQTSSLFYNTAGLNNIPKEYGWEIDLFNMNLSINQNFIDFTDDLDEATSSGTEAEQDAKTLKVVEDYLGENLHIAANTSILSIGKKFDKYAFGLMPFGGLYMNNKTHRGGGSAGIFEVQGIAYAGVALGVSRNFEDKQIAGFNISNLSVGLGIKSVQYKNYYHDFPLPELIDNKDDLLQYVDDNYAVEGSSSVADLGIKANLSENFSIGLSAQNIGAIGDKETIEIPMTIGVGMAYSNRFNRSWLNQYQIGVDYIDILQAYSQDEDLVKRTRLGVSGNLFDGWAGTFGIQAGLYQGHATYGIDFRATMLKIAYTSYAEEVGAYAGQDEDRRHMLQISFGW